MNLLTYKKIIDTNLGIKIVRYIKPCQFFLTILYTIPLTTLQEMLLSQYSEGTQSDCYVQWQKLSDPDCPCLVQKERKTNSYTLNTFNY